MSEIGWKRRCWTRFSGGVTIAFDDIGTGPAVLLLHSTACDRRMWDPQILVLADAGFRVVRCDLRGFGGTPLFGQVTSYSNSGDVADLLDSLGIETAAVVGASGGGRVALEVAARWPGRVTRLALLCTALAGHEPSAELRAYGRREDELLEAGDIAGAAQLNVDTWVGPRGDSSVRKAVFEMQRHAFEVQLASTEEPSQEDHDAPLSAITAPSLLISGAHDFADFRSIAVTLAKVLPEARHIELDWAGHLPSLEDPDSVNPILLDFLR